MVCNNRQAATLSGMPVFFFHARDGATFTKDLEGVEFAQIEDARREALRAGKQALADHLNRGGQLSAAMTRSIEIADTSGMVMTVVTYAEAAEAADQRP